MAENNAPKLWAGFWARLFAFFVDWLILAAICGAIGLSAFDYVQSIGSNGRFVGLLLGVAYFTVLTSTIGGGRTLAMRMFGLKVVTARDKPPGLVRAFLRSTVLVGLLVLDGWFFQIPDTPVWRIAGQIEAIVVFAGLAAEIYLFLLNFPSRRLLHDILSGTAVARRDASIDSLPISKVHLTVVAAIFIASGALVFLGPEWVTSTTPALVKLNSVNVAVAALPEVQSVSVQDNTNTSYGQTTTTTRTLLVVARLRRKPADPNAEINRIGKVVAAHYQLARGQRIRIEVVSGIDMGLASFTTSNSNDYPIQQP